MTSRIVPVAVPVDPTAPTSDFINGGGGVETADTAPIGSYEMKVLKEQGYTTGLVQSLNTVKDQFPLRIWVVDNSGSMTKTDGHKIIPSNNKKLEMKVANCSRWHEVQDCVNYHARLSGLLSAPTTFRLLNNAQEFHVSSQDDVDNALNIMSSVSPHGGTPLTRHVKKIYTIVNSMKSSLIKQGKRVVVVLATDGLPTNGKQTSESSKLEFVESLQRLEELPVWLVVRLSTDEAEVVNFYNNLDCQLEFLSMDVLDDFCDEAKEVTKYNPWMNYALPLHRLREMGFHDIVLDLIDERKLTEYEVLDLCRLLFGECELPDPVGDWDGFVEMLKLVLSTEERQWNPITKTMMPWIDIKELERQYGRRIGCGCSIM